MDPKARPPHPDRGHGHLHVGPTLPGDTSAALVQLDAADQVSAGQGLWGIRVPNQFGAQDVAALHAEHSG